MNIEFLVKQKTELEKRIEDFYEKETGKYLERMGRSKLIKFESVYKKLGKGFYASPEILAELKNRIEARQEALKRVTKVKVVCLDKGFSTQDRVYQLLDHDNSLVPGQIGAILNLSTPAVRHHYVKWHCIMDYRKNFHDNLLRGLISRYAGFLKNKSWCADQYTVRDISLTLGDSLTREVNEDNNVILIKISEGLDALGIVHRKEPIKDTFTPEQVHESIQYLSSILSD